MQTENQNIINYFENVCVNNLDRMMIITNSVNNYIVKNRKY